MRRLQAIIATTEVDSQGERMSREALEGLVESFSRSYVPIGIQHDPRIPPQGRVSSGFVRERPNGEFEAVATMELFEDCEPYVGSDTRELLPMRPNVAGLTVSYDWTHRSDEDQSDISAIAAVFGNDAQYDIKKAAEPISIITIAGAFALGGIATGFLRRL